jgi:hypothetical protein
VLNVVDVETPVACLSVHASPRPVVGRYLDQWRACGQNLPPPRNSGHPETGPWWDSDLVMATLKLVADAGIASQPRYEVLAAGDLNEAIAWDDNHAGSWGEDFFGAHGGAGLVADCGLVSVLHMLWGGAEKPTHGGLQLDHVLATEPIGRRMSARTPEDSAQAGWASDHLPIRFSIGTAGRGPSGAEQAR